MLRILGLGATLSLCLATAASAGTPFPVKMKCPLDGERFTHTETMSYTTWGERPDGRPYGSWIFPQPMPVCPGNGLVMYRDFSKDEVVRLKTLVVSPEYRALVSRDTDYYRAAWLARVLEPAGDNKAIWLLLRATWQVDGKPDLKARYQAEFVDAVAALPPKPDDMVWIALQARRANGLRELARFQEATTVVGAIPRSALDVAQPAEPKDGEAQTEAQLQARQQAENRLAWRDYLARLDRLIGRSDRDAEPLDAIPPMVAAQYCLEAKKEGRPAPEACGSDEVRKAIIEIETAEQG